MPEEPPLGWHYFFMSNTRSELTGLKFGYLTIIKYSPKRTKGGDLVGRWECKCDCGNTTFGYTSSLKRGKKLSCGCLLKKHILGLSWEERLYKERKRQALIRKKVWNITLEFFKDIIKKPCYYCGSLAYTLFEKKYSYMGVDRKNDNIGYEESNCVPCCKICNFAKRDMNIEQFVNWIKKVYKYNQLTNGEK